MKAKRNAVVRSKEAELARTRKQYRGVTDALAKVNASNEDVLGIACSLVCDAGRQMGLDRRNILHALDLMLDVKKIGVQ